MACPVLQEVRDGMRALSEGRKMVVVDRGTMLEAFGQAVAAGAAAAGIYLERTEHNRFVDEHGHGAFDECVAAATGIVEGLGGRAFRVGHVELLAAVPLDPDRLREALTIELAEPVRIVAGSEPHDVVVPWRVAVPARIGDALIGAGVEALVERELFPPLPRREFVFPAATAEPTQADLPSGHGPPR